MKKYILMSALLFMSVLSHAATQPTAVQITSAVPSNPKCLTSGNTNVQSALNALDACTASGAGIPGGVNNQIQKNNNGVFAGGNMYAVGNYIGVNQTAPAYQLDVNGIANATGGYVGIQAANVPTLNQNTTGTAAGLSGSQTANTIYAAPNGSSGTAGFRTLVGADLPNPTSSSKGGIQSIAAVSHNFLNSISTSGVPTQAQPAYSDISGTLPAITALTGDVTASGTGSVPTTLATVNGNVGTFQGITVNAKGLVTGATNQGYITGNQPITVSHSGDMTGTATGTTSISIPMTLNTVNTNTGSFGSTTAIPNFTVNGKGLITAAGTNVVVAPAGTLTGATLASNVVSSSLTSVGTITSGTWTGTPLAYQYGGTGLTTAPSNNVAVGNGAGWTLTAITNCNGGSNALTYNTGTNSFGCNAITGGVSSVSNSDGSLTISPTTGAVVASINVANPNTWTGIQQFNANTGFATTPTYPPATSLSVGATSNGGSLTHNTFNVNSLGNITTLGGIQTNINAGGWNQISQGGVIQFGNYDTIGSGDSVKIYTADSTGHIDFAPSGLSTVLDTFNPSGWLGVAGITSPAYPIDAGSNTIQAADVHSPNGLAYINASYGIQFNPDNGINNTPLMYLTYGRFVGINTSSNPVSVFDVANTTSTSTRGILSEQYSNDTDSGKLEMRKARGTEALPSTVISGDNVSDLESWGYDGGNWNDVGRIRISATGTVSAGIIPTIMAFFTTNSSGTQTQAMTIDSSQNSNFYGVVNPNSGINWNDIPSAIPNKSVNWTDFQVQQSSTAGVNWTQLDTKTGGTNWYAVANNAPTTNLVCWKSNGQLGKCTTSISGVNCSSCN